MTTLPEPTPKRLRRFAPSTLMRDLAGPSCVDEPLLEDDEDSIGSELEDSDDEDATVWVADEDDEDSIGSELDDSDDEDATVWVANGLSLRSKLDAIRSKPDAIPPKLDKIPHFFLVELQKGNAKDVAAALTQISHLTNAKDSDSANDPAVKNWKEMQELGPITLVVLCMQKWPKTQSIQLVSCIALANMLDVSWSCGSGRTAMAKSGGLEAVLNAMKAFPVCAQLQSEALRALQNFFVYKESDEESKALVANFAGRLIELGGIALVVQKTKRFHHNVDLLFASCGLLYNMSLLEKHHNALVKNGAVEAVASIQKRYFGNVELKKEAEEFLEKMFTKKP